VAAHRLAQDQPRARHFLRRGVNLEQVVDPPGFEEINVDAPDRESQPFAVLPLVEACMADAQQADEIRAAAFHEADEAAVIDHTGKVGVLEIDAHRQHVAAVNQPACRIGPGVFHYGVLVSLTAKRQG